MSDFIFQGLKSKIRRTVHINMPEAILGDESGNLFDPTIPGNVYVRFLYANGYGKAFSVQGPAGSSVQLVPGTRVKLAQTSDNKLKVETYDLTGGVIDGSNLYAPNVPVPPSSGFSGQQSLITALVTPQNVPDLTVIIKSWIVILGGVYYEFPGIASLDLTSHVPSSGNNRYVMVLLDNDFITPRLINSTPRNVADLPLSAADIQECLTAAPATSIPLAVIRLYGSQTTILNGDIVHDLRQIINTDNQQLNALVKATDQTSAFTMDVPAGSYVNAIVIQEKNGNAITGGLKIGTTAGGTDVIAAQTVGASSLGYVTDANLLKRIFSLTAVQTLHLDAVTGWNSAKIDVYVHLVKLT